MARRPWVAVGLVVLAIMPATAALHSRSFFSPDETSYAQVAREMLESGDFVVPRIDGHPWLEKPPLVYWLLAGAFWLLGWGFPAAVLLNTLLTAATAVLIAAYARRTATPRAGVLAGAAYLTIFLPLATARSALTDPALALCTTAAIVAFLAERWFAAPLAGLCLGLGILAKGPVAPLVVLPAMLAFAIAQRRRRLLGLLVTTGVAALVAIPWHLALGARGLLDQYAAVFLGHQVVSRAVDAWGAGQPWWFYLPVLWAMTFPWGTHLVLAARGWKRRLADGPWNRAEALAEAAAVLVPLVAFSLASNKLPHYLLPVLPWLAVWLGRAADALLEGGEADRVVRVTTAASAGVGAAALALVPVLGRMIPGARLLATVPSLVALGAALFFAAFGVAETRGKWRTAWCGLAFLALTLRCGLDLGALPFLDRHAVERPLAQTVKAQLPSNGVPIAHRWWRSSFVAYGVRGWVRTETRVELDVALAEAARQDRPALLLVRADAEGDARAATWRRGGAAREVARISGLGEINGATLEGVVLLADAARDGRRWFYDADEVLPGESGFAGLEGNAWTPSFRWTTGLRATLPMAARPTGKATLRLRAWGLEHDGAPQRLALSINGCRLGEIRLARLPGVFELPVPARCLAAATQTLVFEAGHLVVPRLADPTSSDLRSLAFALDWIALDPISPQVDLTADTSSTSHD